MPLPFGTRHRKYKSKDRTGTARWVTNQPCNPLNLSSVAKMVEHLEWPSLQQRRLWADVTLMYKPINSLIAVLQNYHPTKANIPSTGRSHSMEFIPIQ